MMNCYLVLVVQLLKMISFFDLLNQVNSLFRRASVLEYLRQHDEKLGISASAATHLPTNQSNPWAGEDFYRPIGSTDASFRRPLGNALITKSSAPRGGQILIYLLRLRQCCSHLSILKEVKLVFASFFYSLISYCQKLPCIAFNRIEPVVKLDLYFRFV